MRFVIAVVLLALASSARAEVLPDNLRRGFGFDFYVLALSWSPSWCAANDPDASSRQCDLDADNRFIVHGLWPQFERGYPEWCETGEPEVSRRYEDALLPIMPSRGLIERQWDKHGSCSGLRQAEYFSTLAHAWKRVDIPQRLAGLTRDQRIAPDEVEGLFEAANPGLTGGAVAVQCRAGRMTEVRVCLDKELNFRTCQEVDRRGCTGRPALVPAPR